LWVVGPDFRVQKGPGGRGFTEVAEVLNFRDFGPYRRQRFTDRIALMGFENLDGGREVIISTTKRSAEAPP
jgi:hypothetical protein